LHAECRREVSIVSFRRAWQTEEVSRVEKLRALVEDVSGKAAPEDLDESLFESGLLDSFALPDLVSAIEKAFSVKIPDADLNPRKFDSIARIDAYLAARD
jgi:acyl carrier protein